MPGFYIFVRINAPRTGLPTRYPVYDHLKSLIMRNKFLLLNGLIALSLLSSVSPIRANTLATLPEATTVDAASATAGMPAHQLNFRERLTLRILRHKWQKLSRDREQPQPKDSSGPTIKNYNTASMVFGIVGDVLLSIASLTFAGWSGAWILLVVAVIALIAGLSLGISGLKKHPKRGQGIAGVILSGGGLAGLLLTILELLFLIYVLGG